MSKVTGIKSVDFKITAYGYGVVNWNGPTTLVGDDGKQKTEKVTKELQAFRQDNSIIDLSDAGKLYDFLTENKN